MLVVLQLPFADLRPLLAIPTNQLDRPHWADPSILIEDALKGYFVHGIGGLRTRHGHGDLSWANEGIFCGAKNAIRFPAHLDEHQFGPHKAPISGFKGTSVRGSRRFYAYGPIVRFEISMSRKWAPHHLGGDQLAEFLRSLLAVPLRIDGNEQSMPINAARAELGKLVLRSTTSRNNTPDLALCKLRPGRPMIIVKYREGEIEPAHGQPLLPAEYHVDLSYRDVRLGNTEAQAWLLGTNESSDRDALHRVRIHLARLHAELECVRLVLSALPDLDISQLVLQKLKDYLQRFIDLLDKQQAYGHPQAPILKQALTAYQTEYPNDWFAVEQDTKTRLSQIEIEINRIQKQTRDDSTTFPYGSH
jgi:hypothetical protein